MQIADFSMINLRKETEPMSIVQSKFVWYDVMTSNCKAAESFYSSVIGWKTEDSGMPDRSYTILSVGPTMVGGLMPIPEESRATGARPCWKGGNVLDMLFSPTKSVEIEK
jgi:hypothetical protein